MEIPEGSKREFIIEKGTVSDVKPVWISGSKNCLNHATSVMFLGGEDCVVELRNVPAISDKRSNLRLLTDAGISHSSQGSTVRSAGVPTMQTLSRKPSRSLRVSICHLVALAARTGSARGYLPGGDRFTRRPIDLHKKLVESAGGRLVLGPDEGLSVLFPQHPTAFDSSVSSSFGPSVGATVTALLLAAAAKGTSVIRDAAQEPEVRTVVSLLRQLGVRIDGESSENLRVVGRPDGLSGNAVAILPADISVAGTYMLLGLLHQTSVQMDNLRVSDFPLGAQVVFDKLGIVFNSSGGDSLTVSLTETPRPVTLCTGPAPGFPSDLQPQLAAFLSQADGTSYVSEAVYEKRNSHVRELRRVGVSIREERGVQIIEGPQAVRKGMYYVDDIRSGAAGIIASSVAPGPVVFIDRKDHLGRGYPALEESLRMLGVQYRKYSPQR